MAVNNVEKAANTYEDSGVARLDERLGFRSLISDLRETFKLRPGQSKLDFGCYASILDIGLQQAIAISTDGIGSKAIIAQMMDRYDTVGIDCVAMNANDVLCVGAEPISMLDYIAVEVADDLLLMQIGKGLREGAEQANITIPGGEISQIPEIIKSERPGRGFDLVGTCVGLVDKDHFIAGADVRPNDVIVGLASTGIHSNGLTLARRVLLDGLGLSLSDEVPELGRKLGEELIEPTRIYVKPVLAMLSEGLGISGLCHVTSDGFLNLARVLAPVGFEIDHLPDAPPIFDLIGSVGGVSDAEMFRVYNMGIGFCVICRPESASRVQAIASNFGVESWILGRCTDDRERVVHIRPKRLVGRAGHFTSA